MDQLVLGNLMMKLGKIPLLPHVAGSIMKMTDDPKSTTHDISRVICQDQVLATKVLKLVNSAYYGLSRRVGTISEAVTVLGMKTVRTLVIGASVHKSLSGFKGNQEVKSEHIWRHGMACAVSCRLLARELGIIHHEQAFMAGLLHDFGKIIFSTLMAEEYQRVIQMTGTGSSSLVESEMEIIGLTHAELGRIVAEKWSLPATLVQPIGYHHVPFCDCENTDLVQIVYIADIISKMAGYHCVGSTETGTETALLGRWNLTREKLYRMSEDIPGNIGVEFL